MKIFLPIVPPKTTHHSKKIVRIGKFHKLADKPELTEVISDYMSLLQPYAPLVPSPDQSFWTWNLYFPGESRNRSGTAF